ncbi:hypothetical protein [Psychrobacillus sp. FSL H8-0487]|uniref:hypothetical protein n=1 Tax=Psychrobacillus sp. FSL H8-0487 TaxID=2921391 RepID=UPI0030F57A72
MKVAIVQPNEILTKLVLCTRQFTSSVEIMNLEDVGKEKKLDVLIMEHQGLTPTDIIQLRQQFQSMKILIVAEQIDTFFEKSCIAHDILLISNEMSQREQLDTIQKAWFGLEEQTEYHNVVAVYGTHRQVGVTQTALSIGNALGSFNHKTLVIGLNPYNPGEDTKKPATYSFDQIYDLVQSNVINSGETLIPYLEKYDHFYYLTGNRDFYKALSFDGKTVEQLIRLAKEHFQAVVLDIGSFYDSYLPLTGLQMSNTHILVSSQEQLSIDEFSRWQEQVLSRFDFYPKTSYQVVNKYASKAILTSKHLEEKLELPILTQIPFFPESNDALIEDGILYLSEYAPYNKVIDGIARAIGDEILAITNNEKEKKSIFGLGRRKA